MKLHPTQPYDFKKLLELLRRFPSPSSFSIQEDAYYQVFRDRHSLSLIRVRETEDGLQIERLDGDAPEQWLVEQTVQILGVNRDLQPFYAYAKTQPDLWHVIAPLHGMPLYCTPNLYHALIYVIIEQHISWVAAQRAQLELVKWGGNFVEYDGFLHYAIPTPEQLAQASIEDLRPLKITFKRMQLLIDISQAVVDGRLDVAAIAQKSPQAVYKELLKIKGVGHWTASVVIGRVFGVFPDIPHNDVALQAAVAHYFGVEKSAKATLAQFQQYGEYAGLAANFTLSRWVLDMYPMQSGNEDEP